MNTITHLLNLQFSETESSVFRSYFLGYRKCLTVSESKLLNKIDSTCEYDISYLVSVTLGKIPETWVKD